MRILVAEDEKDLNSLISEALEEAGYSVDRCYDGGEALDFLDCAEYDAAVLDILMPVKSGRDVVREMRAHGNSTPVLFLTALDSVDDRVAGLDDGADDYLVKPFAFPELLARKETLGSSLRAFGVFPKLSGTPGRVWRGAPRLGQDTDEILRVVLGRGEEEIRRLHAEGTV